MHLSAGQLVDLAEGTQPESAAPHLASCAVCRRQLADMRAMMSVAADVEMPEPSPLFWDHLSARVGEAVAAERAPRRSWIGEVPWPRLVAPLASAAALVLIALVVFSSRGPATRGRASIGAPDASSSPLALDAGTRTDLLSDSTATEDASLTLVAALTDDMDPEGAGEADLAGRGSAEHAVTHLNDGELRELRRLLTEALARPGA
jgi:hypothetical protein